MRKMTDCEADGTKGHNGGSAAFSSGGSDELASGLAALTREPLLTPEEERMLAAAAQRGDLDARRRLVEANMRLVINIARRYSSPDVPLEDLVQEGAIGLMTACERFDPSRGFRFSTYATHWIRQAISRAIDLKGRAVRVPSYVAEIVRRFERCRGEIAREIGHDPPLELVASRMGVPTSRLVLYLRATQSAMSIEALAGHEERSRLLGVGGNPVVADPEEQVISKELRREIERILDSLTERERAVMRQRFGFDSEEEAALQDIGSQFGISRERVRQIEALALRRLRAAARRRRLQEYLA